MQNSDEKPEPKIVTAPPTYQDSESRTWTIKLTLGLIERVQTDTQIDLIPDNGDFEPVISLCSSPKKLARVLWECSRAQAERETIDFQSFSEAFDGKAFFAGWTALQDAIHFFIRSLKGEAAAAAFEAQQEAVLKVLKAQAETQIAVIQSRATDESLKKAAKQIGDRMQQELTKEFENSATNLPGFANKTRATSR